MTDTPPAPKRRRGRPRRNERIVECRVLPPAGSDPRVDLAIASIPEDALDTSKHYNPEVHLPIARELAAEGVSLATIAAKCGVSSTTLISWRKEFPELQAAIDEGRQVLIANVEVNGLYRSCVGYFVEKTERMFDGDRYDAAGNEKVPISTKVVKEWVKPDSRLIIFALCNNAPDIWQDTPTKDNGKDKERTAVTPDAKNLLAERLKKLAEGTGQVSLTETTRRVDFTVDGGADSSPPVRLEDLGQG
jgi:lambda repressor-like predicted transcriptional regulator